MTKAMQDQGYEWGEDYRLLAALACHQRVIQPR
jgi:hypothetical protein